MLGDGRHLVIILLILECYGYAVGKAEGDVTGGVRDVDEAAVDRAEELNIFECEYLRLLLLTS